MLPTMVVPTSVGVSGGRHPYYTCNRLPENADSGRCRQSAYAVFLALAAPIV